MQEPDMDGIEVNESEAGEPFNRQETLTRLAGDEELFLEVSILLREESEQRLTQIREALGSGDAETIRRAAHTLKGSVSFFGASIARLAAQKLEKVAAVPEEAAAAFLELEREVNRLRDALPCSKTEPRP